MPTVYLEHTELMSAREKHGVLEEVRLLARVIGLTSTDYNVFWEAVGAAGIPAAGATLESLNPYLYGQNPYLVLTERNPSIHDRDPGTFDIELVWQPNIDNQNFNSPFESTIFGQHRSSVRQIETGTYQDPPLSGNVVLIEVGHKYQFPDSRAGLAGKQGARVPVFQPERNFRAVGYCDSSDPWNLERYLVASTNSHIWQNEVEGTWMCTEAPWHRMGGLRVHFEFEFQHNPDGWDPIATFTDPDTGRPPIGLGFADGFYGFFADGTVIPAGRKKIPYHHRVNYSLLFNAWFEGFQQF